MSRKDGFMWECECGYIEYGKNPPDECRRCSAIDSFIKVPEDMIAEKEEQSILSSKLNNAGGDEDEEY